MADDTEDGGYEPTPVIPTTSTTAETEQGGVREPMPPPPAPRPTAPRPGPVVPPLKPPPAPQVKAASVFTPWRIFVGLVLVGGAGFAVYELTPKGGSRGR